MKDDFFMTKNERVLEYLKSLPEGTKISVRSLAQALKISEGTAYKAIKDAESMYIVTTIPRAGTIRTKPKNKLFDRLTYEEIKNVVDGTVLGGENGLNIELNKFLIGAMTTEEMVKYIQPGDLIILGNRDNAQMAALKAGAAVLITGGFDAKIEVKTLADKLSLPLISTTYDTFTVATLINKAVNERMTKKRILLVSNIMSTNPIYMTTNQTVNDWKALLNKTSHTRYPVVDESGTLVGIVTSREIAKADDYDKIGDIMARNPIYVTETTTVAFAAHLMIWWNIEVLPVTNNKELVGIISREDVIKALQYMAKQPQIEETINDTLLKDFHAEKTQDGMKFYGTIPQNMVNQLGTVSSSALMMLMSECGISSVTRNKRFDAVVDNFLVYFIRPLQTEKTIEVNTAIIDYSGNFCKVEISVLYEETMIAKALMSLRLLKNKKLF
ncbi:putative signal transduction protein with CBS and DRTGG domains [Thermoanaerobacterium aotearoense SCUT27]|uniref:Signal transduction protein with CBS and DRTGG domains n=3 Tax=Thermoanaerobacterium TaxID=28895 RepID=I3VV21_THESW|nr:putative signal transduction protein with CBS and DRTGG domains [Thermoanaerobacterium saccharolyticum JW/SL-YS485]ETO37144.1 putative signal transduction protein with CBS and DRTGG domains [Thermoanaerobacterium aotearoense SCUT27]